MRHNLATPSADPTFPSLVCPGLPGIGCGGGISPERKRIRPQALNANSNPEVLKELPQAEYDPPAPQSTIGTP